MTAQFDVQRDTFLSSGQSQPLQAVALAGDVVASGSGQRGTSPECQRSVQVCRGLALIARGPRLAAESHVFGEDAQIQGAWFDRKHVAASDSLDNRAPPAAWQQMTQPRQIRADGRLRGGRSGLTPYRPDQLLQRHYTA